MNTNTALATALRILAAANAVPATIEDFLPAAYAALGADGKLAKKRALPAIEAFWTDDTTTMLVQFHHNPDFRAYVLDNVRAKVTA